MRSREDCGLCSAFERAFERVFDRCDRRRYRRQYGIHLTSLNLKTLRNSPLVSFSTKPEIQAAILVCYSLCGRVILCFFVRFSPKLEIQAATSVSYCLGGGVKSRFFFLCSSTKLEIQTAMIMRNSVRPSVRERAPTDLKCSV